MTREELSQAIIQEIADQAGVEQHKLSEQTHITNDLGLDSLDHVELIMELESEYDLVISDEAAEGLLIIKDIVDYIDKHWKR